MGGSLRHSSQLGNLAKLQALQFPNCHIGQVTVPPQPHVPHRCKVSVNITRSHAQGWVAAERVQSALALVLSSWSSLVPP